MAVTRSSSQGNANVQLFDARPSALGPRRCDRGRSPAAWSDVDINLRAQRTAPSIDWFGPLGLLDARLCHLARGAGGSLLALQVRDLLLDHLHLLREQVQ